MLLSLNREPPQHTMKMRKTRMLALPTTDPQIQMTHWESMVEAGPQGGLLVLPVPRGPFKFVHMSSDKRGILEDTHNSIWARFSSLPQQRSSKRQTRSFLYTTYFPDIFSLVRYCPDQIQEFKWLSEYLVDYGFIVCKLRPNGCFKYSMIFTHPLHHKSYFYFPTKSLEVQQWDHELTVANGSFPGRHFKRRINQEQSPPSLQNLEALAKIVHMESIYLGRNYKGQYNVLAHMSAPEELDLMGFADIVTLPVVPPNTPQHPRSPRPTQSASFHSDPK